MSYSQGTISTVSGSAMIRGTGTRFKDNINGVAPAQFILIQSGNGNLLHMIQAVNSDTELVLADTVPVTLNNVKYQIQTTVPDSVSDGVRHILAINSYITIFLQNMDKWMSQNGTVAVTLPNGQTVSLQSIRALQAAMLDKNQNGADIPDKQAFVRNVGLSNVAYQNRAVQFTDTVTVNGGGWTNFLAQHTGTGLKTNFGTQGEFSYIIMQTDFHTHSTYRFTKGVNGDVLALGGNCWRDNNGFIKQGSPIIQIHPDGKFTTNDESEGATVSKLGIGHYQVTGVLGYNADGAWGVHGGLSVPRDSNGNELVYVEDKVLPDGAIDIKVTHRQNTHMPARLQNRRLKSVDEQTYYTDDEPCDLPAGTRLDVRVQMPEDSVWNVRQEEVGDSS
ncbi:hypothetical protein [Xenorhabdus sp. PB62.4]|uniref:phage tail fiber protein n=1 Tax=Xenorhabdus sp. PB62.4 TaxID=1851573 RepID=UPI0021073248|nr:hypothetical protein [Xenorhabdus sp. PB62.4]MBC8954949.1 NgrE [Xenorhabdus sp. PB62.4]